jgi:hypothetical protein
MGIGLCLGQISIIVWDKESVGEDLYRVLGVSRNADAASIKSAYRQQAKDSHPDHGNDPDAFRQLKDAYDVLSDPGFRAHYDLTGETPADKALREADEARFRQLLGDLLVTTIAQAGAPAFTDIVEEARRSVRLQLQAVKAELATLRQLAERIAEVLRRLHEPKGETVLHTVLTERLGGIEGKIATCGEIGTQLGRLLKGLEGYGYDVQIESLV